MIEKDNDFVKKKFKLKLLHSPGAIKSLYFGSACNAFTKHCLCEKLKSWVGGWGRSDNSLNKPLWEPKNTKKNKQNQSLSEQLNNQKEESCH